LFGGGFSGARVVASFPTGRTGCNTFFAAGLPSLSPSEEAKALVLGDRPKACKPVFDDIQWRATVDGPPYAICLARFGAPSRGQPAIPLGPLGG